MAAALECWSGRPSTDEEMVEQVLMKTHPRSESFPNPPPAAGVPPPAKKWQRLGRNFAGAIAALKNSLNLDAPRDSAAASRFDRLLWGGVVRSLTQLYPGSQLPDRLISNIRRHFDSLPNSYSQAGYDMKEVLLHVRLIDQATAEEQAAIHIQEFPESNADEQGSIFRLTFAICNSPVSTAAMSTALEYSSLVCCKKIQIFEKKGLTLGVVTLLVQPEAERAFKSRIESALKAAIKKKGLVKLPFGLCGCQDEGPNNTEDEFSSNAMIPTPLTESSLVVSVDEWQTIGSGGEEIGRWLLSSDEVEFVDRVGPNSFKGVYRGKKVWIKKLRGCERGTAFEVEVRRDLVQLMSCGQRNILQFHGVCIDENHGMCVLTRMMDGGSVHDGVQKGRRLPAKEVTGIAVDIAEGLRFMNDHGVPYRDLNAQRILLDRMGSACIGDMGVVASCSNSGEVTEYETAGYRWLAPEIIAGDPESVTETWMSNVYSFGMVIWEMVAGEAAYSTYSPVQAAVGIAACGLRPEIPKNCPQLLRSLMLKCWDNCPSNRPQFSEIITILQKHNNR